MELLTAIIEYIGSVGALLVAGLAVAMPVLATLHVLMTRNEPRAAMAWFGFVWFVPIVGVAFYLLFGMKRIERRARLDRMRSGLEPRPGLLSGPRGITLKDLMPLVPQHWEMHSVLSEKVSRFTLSTGNDFTVLKSGREAYDAMITAIDGAQSSVALSTYIFQADQAGRRVVKALIRAHERGVKVKVLVDAVGNWYGLRPVANILRRHDMDIAFFNPARLSWRLAFFNLRTHRKMLIVDGITGFTGGMNIRKSHVADESGNPKVRDTHFSVTGPAVDQLMYSFADDWAYSTGEVLNGEPWFGERISLGEVMADTGVIARAIADGPDEDVDKTAEIWCSALAVAQNKVMIQSPYFVPGETLINGLCQAAMRGVDVTIVMPARSNLRFVDWASWVAFAGLIKAGVRVLHGTAPFDHSKLFMVDDLYVMIGSSNWDARSLLLNFEFNVEIYDQTFAHTIGERIFENSRNAKEITMDDIKNRPWAKRLRDKFFWLASPYL